MRPASDYADIWRAADKVVFSRTLDQVTSAKTRIEREFDVEAIQGLKAAAERDIGIGGPELAGEAIKAGLVDDYHLFVSPIVVGGGNPSLPSDARVELSCRSTPLRQRRDPSALPRHRLSAGPLDRAVAVDDPHEIGAGGQGPEGMAPVPVEPRGDERLGDRLVAEADEQRALQREGHPLDQ